MRMLAPFLSLLLGPLQPEVAAPFIPWDAISVVQCGNAVGTAFHIGGGRYLTAAHVVQHGGCTIGGSAVSVTKQDGMLDVAELKAPPIAAKLTVDCRPPKPNRHYLAVGYSGGIMRLHLPLIYSAFGRDPGNGNGMFVGPDVHPGMSGGPLIGEDYRVAGIVTQRWPSRVRSLADSHVCKGA